MSSAGPLWGSFHRDARWDLLGIGEISLDRVAVLAGPLRFGDTRSLETLEEHPGGQIATAVLACARLGGSTAFAGTVGDDGAAEAILAPLVRADVDLGGVKTIAGAKSRSALILVEQSTGERSVLGYREAALAIRPEQLSRRQIEEARVLLVDARDPDAACYAAGVARAAGIPVVLDADRSWPDPQRLLERVDFPLVARSFAEELGGSGSLREGLRALCAYGARMAVVTLGSRGALALRGDRWIETSAFGIEARDTTGAGDAFHAGFIWALLQGGDETRCMEVAHAVAALNCLELGAQGGLPDSNELDEFLTARAARSAARGGGEGEG